MYMKNILNALLSPKEISVHGSQASHVLDRGKQLENPCEIIGGSSSLIASLIVNRDASTVKHMSRHELLVSAWSPSRHKGLQTTQGTQVGELAGDSEYLLYPKRAN